MRNKKGKCKDCGALPQQGCSPDCPDPTPNPKAPMRQYHMDLTWITFAELPEFTLEQTQAIMGDFFTALGVHQKPERLVSGVIVHANLEGKVLAVEEERKFNKKSVERLYRAEGTNEDG